MPTGSSTERTRELGLGTFSHVAFALAVLGSADAPMIDASVPGTSVIVYDGTAGTAVTQARVYGVDEEEILAGFADLYDRLLTSAIDLEPTPQRVLRDRLWDLYI